MKNRMKGEKYFLLIGLFILFGSCMQNGNLDSKLVEIEKSLNIMKKSQSTEDRLEEINKAIRQRMPANRYAFGAYEDDTIKLGTKYRANFVLAFAERDEKSTLVLNFNDCTDTIPFDNSLGVFDISLKPENLGINKYNGYILHELDSTRYPFEMSFYVE